MNPKSATGRATTPVRVPRRLAASCPAAAAASATVRVVLVERVGHHLGQQADVLARLVGRRLGGSLSARLPGRSSVTSPRRDSRGCPHQLD